MLTGSLTSRKVAIVCDSEIAQEEACVAIQGKSKVLALSIVMPLHREGGDLQLSSMQENTPALERVCCQVMAGDDTGLSARSAWHVGRIGLSIKNSPVLCCGGSTLTR